MTMEKLCEFMGWCLVLNIGLLVLWGLTIFLARAPVYRLHAAIFKLSSEERFLEIHYQLILGFKAIVFVFNFVPYVALRIIGGS